MPLPDFDIPTIYDLRRLWVAHAHDPEVRCLILGIVRARDRMQEMKRLYEVIDKCWKADVGGNLVALENLRVILLEEGWRNATMGKPTLEDDQLSGDVEF
ncbi:hypothetical protein ACQKRQ_34250 [Paraburkholderia sp. NPDC080076]|uniref:hypothetical protein n=1 Tax=Paraburkholderia sp. NPDC080076 TaxID=3390605 RepID=UPI003D023D79